MLECLLPDAERLLELTVADRERHENADGVRVGPGGETEEELDALNAALGEALLEDGRFYAGTTKYGTKTALRPALVNWRTRESDLEEFVAVVRELGSRVAARGRR